MEQVVTETLRTVRDIWKKYGEISEIHVELGREMKNPADKRSKMNRRMLENENANMRAKLLLTEFMNPEFGIENVRSYSPSQQELLRIYEDGAISNAGSEIDDEISDIMNRLSQVDVKKQPTVSEVKRYILWLEPVSYTHLDVYKRQASSSVNEKSLRRCTRLPALTVYGFDISISLA